MRRIVGLERAKCLPGSELLPSYSEVSVEQWWIDVFEQFYLSCLVMIFCVRGRQIAVFGAPGGENPSASCMRLGADECEHDWFFFFLLKANEMFPLLIVDELAARGKGTTIS